MALPALTAPVPRVVDASKNITEPVGVPLEVLMVAVKVTLPPRTEGDSEVPSVVVVGSFEAAFTTCVTPAEVLEA